MRTTIEERAAPAWTDEQLVAAAREGDSDAFATIYDRYAEALFNAAYRQLGNREEAADVVQDTFVLASERFEQLRDPSRLKSWLYAIATRQALRVVRARLRSTPTDEFADIVDGSATPDEQAERGDLAILLRTAAQGLSSTERVILGLHLSGMSPAEIAESVGQRLEGVHVTLHRLRSQVELALGALLMLRRARRDCDGLASAVGRWDGDYTPRVRKRVVRHLRDCPACQARRSRMMTPEALLALLPWLAIPAVVRSRVLDRISLSPAALLAAGSAGKVDWLAEPGKAPVRYQNLRELPNPFSSVPTIVKLAVATGVIAMLIGIGAWRLDRGPDPERLDPRSSGQPAVPSAVPPGAGAGAASPATPGTGGSGGAGGTGGGNSSRVAAGSPGPAAAGQPGAGSITKTEPSAQARQGQALRQGTARSGAGTTTGSATPAPVAAAPAQVLPDPEGEPGRRVPAQAQFAQPQAQPAAGAARQSVVPVPVPELGQPVGVGIALPTTLPASQPAARSRQRTQTQTRTQAQTQAQTQTVADQALADQVQQAQQLINQPVTEPVPQVQQNPPLAQGTRRGKQAERQKASLQADARAALLAQQQPTRTGDQQPDTGQGGVRETTEVAAQQGVLAAQQAEAGAQQPDPGLAAQRHREQTTGPVPAPAAATTQPLAITQQPVQPETIKDVTSSDFFGPLQVGPDSPFNIGGVGNVFTTIGVPGAVQILPGSGTFLDQQRQGTHIPDDQLDGLFPGQVTQQPEPLQKAPPAPGPDRSDRSLAG